MFKCLTKTNQNTPGKKSQFFLASASPYQQKKAPNFSTSPLSGVLFTPQYKIICLLPSLTKTACSKIIWTSLLLNPSSGRMFGKKYLTLLKLASVTVHKASPAVSPQASLLLPLPLLNGNVPHLFLFVNAFAALLVLYLFFRTFFIICMLMTSVLSI